MHVKDLFSTGAIKQPWPLMVNGTVIGISEMGISKTCKNKCGRQPACSEHAQEGEHTFKNGLSCLSTSIANNRVTVYGVRGEENNTPINFFNRAGLKGRSITKKEFAEWVITVNRLLSGFESEFGKRQAEMLDPLHDITRLAKQISIISNRIVQADVTSVAYEEQVDNASPELKTLVKAADLLNDSFDLLVIYFNPAAAKFGGVHSINMHGLLRKLVAIFCIDYHGEIVTDSKIQLSGACYTNVSVYESFKLIPFAILTNAVKYSLEGIIRVLVTDSCPIIHVSVESIGPYIEENERDIIFHKKGRGKWASTLRDGKGVGLYLASVIAKAHGITIKVSSTTNGKKLQGNIPLAMNIFSFAIDS